MTFANSNMGSSLVGLRYCRFFTVFATTGLALNLGLRSTMSNFSAVPLATSYLPLFTVDSHKLTALHLTATNHSQLMPTSSALDNTQASATSFCHKLLSQASVTSFCHKLLSQASPTSFCHKLLSQASVTSFCHKLLSQASATS